ncbi:hypothetical protein [Sphingomonas sp. Leaf198]|uniref:hypothetical protein n=1 Tax=Sphingomonas sp. Leaf198 TaxID=1736299 RepID=UPI000700D795|nr:hypothetical protein [Sphingomonas sp. Leaf198]KQS51298.1 hypothetical protein ASG20_04455 [Sphingomonas sp. Leaf198]
MSQDEGARPRRQERGKRAARVDTGDRIVFRVNAEERQRLVSEAGELGISAYVRARLFGGGVRNRDALRKIAALHVAGRRIQQLAEKPGVDEFVIADTLGDVCAAIRGLVDELDDVVGDDEKAPAP